MAELADAPDLGSGGQPCRFNSCYPHQRATARGESRLGFSEVGYFSASRSGAQKYFFIVITTEIEQEI